MRKDMDEEKDKMNETVKPEPAENQQQAVENPAERDLAAKLAEAEKQADTYKDLMYRKAAEFENYKKRAENEIASVVKFANESLIGDMLPVLDDFERSLKAAKTSKEFESLYRGIELIYQKLVKNLEKRGVKTFDTVGKAFNVDFHDALLQVPREDVAPHTVIEEIDKGYTLHDKVIRHAKVIVSTSPVEDSSAAKSDPSVSENQSQSGKS